MTTTEAYNTLQKASGIEVGDTVRVLRKAQQNEMGWGTYWAKMMDKTIGETFVVTEVRDGVGIYNLSNYCAYPFFVLELVIKGIKKITVKLNSEYSAIVTKDGIEVGCQKFPLTVIDDLVKAKAEITKK